MLAAGCIFDIKNRKIPVWVLAAGGIWAFAGIVLRVVQAGIPETLLFALSAVMPGAALLVLSFLTEKKIGYGDGIILTMLGCMEGVRTALLVFCIGLFLQSLFAVGLLIAKKADKQSCIPFVPFLLAARMVLLFYDLK